MSSPQPLSRTGLTLLLGALTMFGAFSIDTVFPAFPSMGADFGVDKLAMQQVLSVYLAAYAGMSLFHGPISDAVGRRPVLLIGVALFALASVGCALAPSFGWLLVFRALQGLSAGVGLIVGRAVVRDLHEGEDAQRLMSHVSLVFGVAPAIAPLIGGWIVGIAYWRAIFWFLAAFAGAIWLAVALALPETHPASQRTAFGRASFWRGKRAMIGNPAFMRLAGVMTFNFAALFLYIASAPAFVIDLMGLDTGQFGWFFIPTISGMMLGAFTTSHLTGRLPSARLAGLGFAVCGAAVALNLGYNLVVQTPQAPWAVLPLAVNAFGVAVVFPIATLAMLDMYPRQRGAASSLQAFLGLGFNALIAGLLSAWVSHDPRLLALTAACFTLLAWGLWNTHQAAQRRAAPATTAG